ncbi:MAG: anaerobic ribonucleoside-triphosphate reductase activating protein [Bacteroidales bacterium]|nr:anaerobic ribonucleoside-triphosphate reductase activating protein [Candidatus Minthousia equi]
MTLQVIDISEGTSVDGPGLRTSIYFAGCTHHCNGCHNPQSWDAAAGKPMSIDEIIKVIDYNDFNVTFSGGDPFFQADAVAELAKAIKERLGKNIWCYTGFTWEQLMHTPSYLPLLEQIDVLVDSPFVLEKRNIELLFRGSDNQRIIDVKKSIAKHEIVELTQYY